MSITVVQGHSLDYLRCEEMPSDLALTFLDPPFNQGKDYAAHNDNLPDKTYWRWMTEMCSLTHQHTLPGGAVYFMQREKNTERVLACLREAGWTLQNLIIWKKKTSPVPSTERYGKAYQVIAYATKGVKKRVFHRLRIAPPRLANEKYERETGMYVTDVWDDIRELTSGYFAGDEAIRRPNGERFHKQQAPLALLVCLILSSSKVGDLVFDPFAGTGTTLIAAKQLGRRALGVELDPENTALIHERLNSLRPADAINKLYESYQHTEGLAEIWGQALKC
ncbi:MAG TPA: site-specific DNA-methyltransferase [Aggregatilineales bacterium]|nr:site-specific DNA-methyltransferase [Anaerolineales bacterium]HRE49166.1 site-specific DNA-methyltransferase [Aggregatilineales bacterium]